MNEGHAGRNALGGATRNNQITTNVSQRDPIEFLHAFPFFR